MVDNDDAVTPDYQNVITGEPSGCGLLPDERVDAVGDPLDGEARFSFRSLPQSRRRKHDSQDPHFQHDIPIGSGTGLTAPVRSVFCALILTNLTFCSEISQEGWDETTFQVFEPEIIAMHRAYGCFTQVSVKVGPFQTSVTGASSGLVKHASPKKRKSKKQFGLTE